MPDGTLAARFATTVAKSPESAVRELKEQLGNPSSGVLVFCSPKLDPHAVAKELAASFSCPVVGCTTAGQLGPRGYQLEGMVAVGFSSSKIRLRTYLITEVHGCEARAAVVAQQALLDLLDRPADAKAFGVILVDGLACAEERLAHTLYHALEDIPLVGGSAGDDLLFQHTFVIAEGRAHENAAVLAIFETSLPFAMLKLQHFAPTSKKLVITEADADRRVVHEINGVPAATAYAETLGLDASELQASVFSANPLMLCLNGEQYVRAIKSANTDGSLTFLCAIEEGLVLRIGAATDPIAAIDHAFAEATREIGPASVVFGFDCVMRRLDLNQRGLADRVGTFMAQHKVIGFSTYGEQWNAVHVNQTFAGIAIGA